MSGVDEALLIGLIVTSITVRNDGRALSWLGAGAMIYIVSVAYWRTGMPYAPFIAGLCDAAVCLLIYLFGRLKWETALWGLFWVSSAVNMYYTGVEMGIFPSLSHNAYSVILETINWIALAWIGGNGALQMLGVTNDEVPIRGPWRRLVSFAVALHSERTRKPFHKVAR